MTDSQRPEKGQPPCEACDKIHDYLRAEERDGPAWSPWDDPPIVPHHINELHAENARFREALDECNRQLLNRTQEMEKFRSELAEAERLLQAAVDNGPCRKKRHTSVVNCAYREAKQFLARSEEKES